MKRLLLIFTLLFSLFLVACNNNKKPHYTVNFYYGANAIKSEIVIEGESATAPDVVPLEGYDFVKWDQDFNNVTKNLEIKAIFKIKTFTVKFFSEGFQIGETQTIEYAKEATAPADPIVSGKEFKGWDQEFSNVKKNLEINAIFVDDNNYLVKFLDYNDLPLKIEVVKEGESATPPNVDDIRLGHKFRGWDTNYTNITKDTNIKALYDEVTDKYNITINNDTITVDKGLTDLTYNDYITVEINPKPGDYINKFLVNNKVFSPINNVFSFYIKEDTTLEVIYTQNSSVQIFYLNDLHGAILEKQTETYYEMGLARIANFIKTKQAENPNTIFLAGGDMLQGSALSNYYEGKSTLKLLDMMGLDFFTIGNHEFDWGIDKITTNFGGQTPYVSYPLVSANIFKKGTENLVENAQPYHIIEKGGLKFGIIGYIGIGLESSISASKVADYEFRDPYPIVSQWATYLRETEHVDVVITVGHDANNNTNNQIRSLTGSSKVDLMFNAHSHQGYTDYNSGQAPIIQSSSNGRAVGKVIVDLVEGVIKVDTFDNYSYHDDPLFGSEDVEVLAQIEQYRAETDPIFKTKIITTNSRITRADFGTWVAKLIAVRSGSEVGTQNSGGIRADIEAGDITLETLYTVLPFDNLIKGTVLPGIYADREYSNNLSYKTFLGDFDYDKDYKIVTNEYVFDYISRDKIPSLYQRYGIGEPIIYDGNLRDWVEDELRLQATAGLTFSVYNEILSQPVVTPTSTAMEVQYGVQTFIRLN